MSEILNALEVLKNKKWVDLSHTLTPEIPYFPAFKPIEEKTLFTVSADGFFAKEYTLATQYGTHIDAPIHFCEGKRPLEELEPKEFVLPLFVINKTQAVNDNHDYRLSVDDILAFEAQHGKIPAGSFVAFASGWSDRWKTPEQFYNKDADGNSHTPGWSLEALTFLHEQRNVAVIGHETLDTDSAEDFRSNNDLVGERYWLSQDKYQIEVMANLSQLPATGSLIFVGAPKIQSAPGFTARVFAVVESD